MKTLLRSVMLFLLVGQCAFAEGGTARPKAASLLTERNSKLAYLLSRIDLKQTAGTSNETGAYLVKIFEVSHGEECDVGGSQCEGFDLVISVSSLDLYGDKALYQVKGLSKWEFLRWNTFAEYDSPEYFTSFRVSAETRDGKPLRECGKTQSRGRTVRIAVNPWEIRCDYLD